MSRIASAIALAIVWALVLGWSPGLTLIVVALALFALGERVPDVAAELNGFGRRRRPHH